MILGIDKGVRSEGYIRAAKRMDIPYRLIDCKANDVMQQLRSVDGFIWHWSHMNSWEKRIARAVIIGVQNMGKAVYPDINTCWMFDDKVYEKYLLESIGAPIIPTYLFFDEKQCERWLRHAKYPLVYKWAGGAGSTNVRLVRNFSEGNELMHKHFANIVETEFTTLHHVVAVGHCNNIWEQFNLNVIENMNIRGVVLFQEFVPNNPYDVRVTTIGEKNLIFKRYVRDNDFRASGSGKIDYVVSELDVQAIKIARNITNMIQAQTMTYDFVFDQNGEFKICEMSYGFAEYAIHQAPGWYDSNLIFREERTDVFEDVLKMVVRGMENEK